MKLGKTNPCEMYLCLDVKLIVSVVVLSSACLSVDALNFLTHQFKEGILFVHLLTSIFANLISTFPSFVGRLSDCEAYMTAIPVLSSCSVISSN